ncbi:MAG TPA: hypothetical protein VFF67_00760 [Thermoplasmata archaeon]|nr:hypothetical protein [Thermoplasmata archaeon]
MERTLRTLLVLILVQMVVFLVSLPGFGIETRTVSQYSAWAGPVFLLLTVLVFVLGIAAFVLSRSRATAAARFGFGQGVVAIVTNLLDFSHVGGPAPPAGPLVLGVIAIVVALGELLLALRVPRGAPYHPGSQTG